MLVHITSIQINTKHWSEQVGLQQFICQLVATNPLFDTSNGRRHINSTQEDFKKLENHETRRVIYILVYIYPFKHSVKYI